MSAPIAAARLVYQVSMIVPPVTREVREALDQGLRRRDRRSVAYFSTGAIDGPLKRPWWWREQRAHLAQVVIDDRLATLKAQRHDQLTDPLAGQLRIGGQFSTGLDTGSRRLGWRRLLRVAG